MLKRYCDICKVELDKDEEVKEVKLPNKNLKVCISCLKALEQHIETTSNNFQIKTTKYKKGYNNKRKGETDQHTYLLDFFQLIGRN